MPATEPHILVVDDHKSIREPLAQYLRKNGNRVTTAANGALAYSILRACNKIIASHTF